MQVKVQENGDAILDEERIGLFYLRTGYSDLNYKGEDDWNGRETLELSNAIKVPRLATQLAGFKCFQYYLSKDEVLAKYCPEELIRKDVLRFNVDKLYFPADESQERRKEILQEVSKNVSNFIAKPLKEGGGNNVVEKELESLIQNEEEANLFLFMEKIMTKDNKSTFIREEKFEKDESISELSIYGLIVADGNEIMENKTLGLLLRTKKKNVVEGGVAAGYSIIDFPCLI